MTVRSRNLAALPPDVVTRLETHVSSGSALAIERAENGMPTARLSGTYLHSKRDPSREASRLLRHAGVADGHTLLVYGFGLGYLTEHFLRVFSSGAVVVVEPDTAAFLSAIEARDMSGFLGDERLYLMLETDPDAVIMLLRNFEHTPITRIRTHPFLRAHPDYFERLDRAFQSFRARSEINTNTLKRFGRLWVRNLVRNLPLLERGRGVQQLAGRLAGLPALLLGAGPTLDMLESHIHALRKRTVIVAVDTAVPTLRRWGVAPDFIVAVDPQYWNTRHLDRVYAGGAVLISESSTHPRVFRMLDAPVFFCSSLFPLGTYFERYTGIRGNLGAGGSVATTAWDFARFAGCDPIYMCGVDLGFPDSATHCAGSFFEQRLHTMATRLRPAEHSHFRYLHGGDPVQAASNGGGTVLTDQRMLIYKWWFENQMKIHRDTVTRNLSAEGVAIEGMPWAPIDEPLQLPALRSTELSRRLSEVLSGVPPDSLQGAPSGSPHHVPSESPQEAPSGSPHGAPPDSGSRPVPSHNRPSPMADAARELIDRLEELRDIAAEGLEHTRRLEQALQRGEPAEIESLDQIDERIRSFPHRDIAAFLIHHSLREIVEDASAQWDHHQVIRRSRTVYSGLVESISYHEELLRCAVERYLS